MARVFAKKVVAAGGNKKQVQLVRYGAMRKIGGVKIASVPAVHSNGLSPAYLSADAGKALADNGLTAYVGPSGRYVLTFSNGLAFIYQAIQASPLSKIWSFDGSTMRSSRC